jgi:hypothetical protein
MSEQVKSFWLKNLLKGKVWILGLFVLILNVACGGGGGSDAATPAPAGSATPATPATPPSTPATPPSTPATPATPPPVAGIKIPKELDVVRVAEDI